jgi:large subunit ribosomal protein L2
VELRPGQGAQIGRAAGAGLQVSAREGAFATLRLRSGEIRKVHTECRAVIGEVSNSEHNLRKLGKAGASRWRGVRPTVRGVAMNPVDHPHGGGEGRTSGGRHPVSPWGTPAKGYRTRSNKRTDGMIVRRRYRK